jgi:N-acetylmuramoyl-L-alanine amidase
MSSAFTRIAVAVLAVAVFAQAPREKQISIYTTQTGYSLPVVEHNGADYVGLFEVLEPMGKASARVDKKKWRVSFRNVEGDFEDGRTRARVAGKNLELPDRFVLQNNRGFVSLRSLPSLLAAFTGTPVDFHAAARRLFAGATPVRYTAQVHKGTPPHLTLSFSSPVNPFIATEHGLFRLVFTRDPLISNGRDQTDLADALFTSAIFSEANGAAEITVHVTAPVIAGFSDANRTITLTPVSAPAPPPPQSAAAAPPAPQPSASQPLPLAPAARATFVLIDPAHGGSDRGAALSDKLAEKDAVLALARRLRAELESKGIVAKLLRDGDADISSEQRAATINGMHPAGVIFIHASTVGTGVHIATAPLPSEPSVAPRWDTAQCASIVASSAWANAVAGEIFKRNIGVLRLRASVPPLNEVTVPAFVLEITPPPSGQADSVLAPSYVQTIFSAISTATAAQRDRLTQGAH